MAMFKSSIPYKHMHGCKKAAVLTFGMAALFIISSFLIVGCGSGVQTGSEKTVTVTETKTVVQTVTAAPATPPAPNVLTGVGQQATKQFSLKRGLATFNLQHDGSGHFGVWLMDDKGNQIELLANDSGQPFNGSKAVQIPKDGSYLLDISADGNWSISIEQ